MNITIFVVARDKAKFFLRVAENLIPKHKIIFITTKYSTYRFLQNKSNYEIHMLQNFIYDEVNSQFNEFVDEAIQMDVETNFISKKVARKQFILLADGFQNYFKQYRVDKLIIWNGSMLQGFTASLVAGKQGIEKIFFEIGNFPNKIFMDTQGVNAKSSLMNRDLTICEECDLSEIEKFLDAHKRVKEEAHIVPQSKKHKENKLYLLWDSFYNIFSKYPIVEKERKLIDYIEYIFPRKKVSIDYDKVNYKDMNYILFPLQVSTDSQIIRNSDFSLEESINKALDIAQQAGLNLIIKPHPAEHNKKIIEKIQKLQQSSNKIYLVNENTYLLIKFAKKVITINSTVGIESLIYYKHTEVIGRAFYKKYCEADLKKEIDKNMLNKFLYNYFFNILLDGDFFKNDKINIEI